MAVRLLMALLALLGMAAHLQADAQSPANAEGGNVQPSGQIAGPDTFSLLTDRAPVVSLVGDWRFQPGDDPRYADPAFDDSGWHLLRSNEPWTAQGFDELRGFAWYRFRVVLPPGSQSFSLLLPPIAGAFQAYIDGVRAGGAGGMGPGNVQRALRPTLVPLPGAKRSSPRTYSVALRVWVGGHLAGALPGVEGGGPAAHFEDLTRVGPARELAQYLVVHDALAQKNATSLLILAGLNLLAALIGFALFAIRPSQREYLWFALTTLGWGGASTLQYISVGRTWAVPAVQVPLEAMEMLATLALIAFYRTLLNEKVTWLLRVAVAGVLLQVVPMLLVLQQGSLDRGSLDLWLLVLDLPFQAWVIGLLLRRARAGRVEGQLLLAPAVLLFVLDGVDGVLELGERLGFSASGFHMGDLAMTVPIRILPDELGTLLFLLAMLAVLIVRFAGTSRQQDRVSAELEAARTVQQVLIPDTPPVTPGLGIATAYYPAQEVSGDFFQILQLPDNATLIVLGDVSGKGVPAAMTVSLAVGALRTMAEFTGSPSVLLAGLNRRLHGRGTGFTTCLALRISADGEVVLANAGHLSPYLNGRELETCPALPLGLDTGVTFDERSFRLATGDRMTLLTDGVVEACARIDGHQELFGFGRTESISMEPAATIAQAARSFGQTDDITVLSIYFAETAAA